MKKRSRRGLIALILAVNVILGSLTVFAGEGVIRHAKYNLPGASSVVGDFTVDGEQAFCIQHRMFAPPDGSSFNEYLYHDDDFSKALYYGWKGPEQWEGFEDAWEGVVGTSLVLSEIYNYPNENGHYDYIPIVAAYKDYLASKPVPPNREVKFEKETIKAYYDTEIKMQRTEENKVIGEYGDISFKLPAGVWLKNVTTNRSSEGLVTVPAGHTFFLMAPMRVTGTYETGLVGNSYLFQPMLYNFGSSYQQVGRYKLIKDPTPTTKMNVEWMDVGRLHLIKTQDEGKLLDGATFSLKSLSYEGYEVSHEVKNGELVIENLPVGKYLLTETKAPDSYYIVRASVEVEIKTNETTREIAVNKLEPKGRLNVSKIDIDSKEGIKGVELAVYAAEDIYSALSLKKIYSKDEKVGEIITDADGKGSLENLAMGKYYIKETKQKEGYSKNDKTYDISFKQENFETKIYEVDVTIENAPTITRVSKVDITDSKELPGASMQIIDPKTGDVVRQWVSTDKEEVIKGLVDGKEYILHEDLAPLGYFKTTDIKFTVGADTKVVMKDEPSNTYFSKQDIVTGKNLVGASMQIIEIETGKVICEWTSDILPKHIKALHIGREYILREVKPPKGYELAEDIKFTVSDKMEGKLVVMKDKMRVGRIVIEKPTFGIPKTGDYANVKSLMYLVAAISLMVIMVYSYRTLSSKKGKEDKRKDK